MSPRYDRRLEAARAELRARGGAALLAGPGADLRYLTGYDALPLERLTLLVVPVEGDAVLVLPELERPRAITQGVGERVELRPWGETEDPFGLAVKAMGSGGTAFVSDRLWASFLLRLQTETPGTRFVPASPLTSALRIRKEPDEVAALREAGAIADAVAAEIAAEQVAGRTERELSRFISDRLLARGCERVAFAIVAAGEHAASPHHEPGDREIRHGDALVCDFGGTVEGYGSDITRTFAVGNPSDELVRVHDIVMRAQDAGVAAAVAGAPCEAVDAAARAVITEAGYGDAFIHRTGHGIGLEEHEDPYLVAGNATPLEPGMAFSVEPGIYLQGRLGVRIEDIVVCGEDGPERMNQARRDLVVIR